MRQKNTWNHLIVSWQLQHYFFFLKIINKLNRRDGKRYFIDKTFNELLYAFKFFYKKPVFFFFNLLKKFIPIIGYRRRVRFVKLLRSKLDQSEEKIEMFIKDRRTRKKAKKKLKIRRGKGDNTGRKRKYVKPEKKITLYPWVYSKFARFKIGFRWLITHFRDSILGLDKIKINFFFKFFFEFCTFFKKIKIWNSTFLKREVYGILYRTRIGLHFRW